MVRLRLLRAFQPKHLRHLCLAVWRPEVRGGGAGRGPGEHSPSWWVADGPLLPGSPHGPPWVPPPHGAEGGSCSRVSPYKATNPTIKAPPSWPGHIPESPSPNAITWGSGFQHMGFVCTRVWPMMPLKRQIRYKQQSNERVSLVTTSAANGGLCERAPGGGLEEAPEAAGVRTGRAERRVSWLGTTAGGPCSARREGEEGQPGWGLEALGGPGEGGRGWARAGTGRWQKWVHWGCFGGRSVSAWVMTGGRGRGGGPICRGRPGEGGGVGVTVVAVGMLSW